MKRELTIKNQEQELARVSEFMESVCEELELDMHQSMKLQLVIEEMTTNVIFYAYPEGTSADITLTAESDGKELTFVLSDTGKPFDPTPLLDDASHPRICRQECLFAQDAAIPIPLLPPR